MIAFLKEANQAEKYAQQENPERIRYFLKKIGSNFRITDRVLVLDFKNAFKIAEKYHAEALCADLPAGEAGAISYDFTKSENLRAEQDYFRTAIMAMNKPIWTPERDRARREMAFNAV